MRTRVGLWVSVSWALTNTSSEPPARERDHREHGVRAWREPLQSRTKQVTRRHWMIHANSKTISKREKNTYRRKFPTVQYKWRPPKNIYTKKKNPSDQRVVQFRGNVCSGNFLFYEKKKKETANRQPSPNFETVDREKKKQIFRIFGVSALELNSLVGIASCNTRARAFLIFHIHRAKILYRNLVYSERASLFRCGFLLLL